jgi:hypothetical protein
MKDRTATAQAQLDALGPNGDPWKVHQAGARVRRSSDLLEQWTQPVNPAPRQVEIQALQIGDLALVAMPGEPFAEIGAAVRKASPYDFTMFCGYSDGIGGDYMPTGDQYEHGGYEVERTLYDPGADAKVIEAATALLHSLKR